jgi:hypothetical protein
MMIGLITVFTSVVVLAAAIVAVVKGEARVSRGSHEYESWRSRQKTMESQTVLPMVGVTADIQTR